MNHLFQAVNNEFICAIPSISNTQGNILREKTRRMHTNFARYAWKMEWKQQVYDDTSLVFRTEF